MVPTAPGPALREFQNARAVQDGLSFSVELAGGEEERDVGCRGPGELPVHDGRAVARAVVDPVCVEEVHID